MLCYLNKKTDETAKDFLQRRGRRSSPLEWNKSFPRTTSWRRSPDWERNGACPFRWIYVPLHLAPHHLELRLWIVWQGWGLNGQHGVFVSTALNGKPSFSRNIQVKFNLTFPYPTQSRIQIISWTLCSALQSQLKWESGYVAQRTPLSPVSMVNMQTGVFIWRKLFNSYSLMTSSTFLRSPASHDSALWAGPVPPTSKVSSFLVALFVSGFDHFIMWVVSFDLLLLATSSC